MQNFDVVGLTSFRNGSFLSSKTVNKLPGAPACKSEITRVQNFKINDPRCEWQPAVQSRYGSRRFLTVLVFSILDKCPSFTVDALLTPIIGAASIPKRPRV